MTAQLIAARCPWRHSLKMFCGCCSGRGRVGYEDLSEGEQLELQQLVLRYLNG